MKPPHFQIDKNSFYKLKMCLRSKKNKIFGTKHLDLCYLLVHCSNSYVIFSENKQKKLCKRSNWTNFSEEKTNQTNYNEFNIPWFYKCKWVILENMISFSCQNHFIISGNCFEIVNCWEWIKSCDASWRHSHIIVKCS